MPVGHGASSLVEVRLLFSESLWVQFPHRTFYFPEEGWLAWEGKKASLRQRGLVLGRKPDCSREKNLTAAVRAVLVLDGLWAGVGKEQNPNCGS